MYLPWKIEYHALSAAYFWNIPYVLNGRLWRCISSSFIHEICCKTARPGVTYQQKIHNCLGQDQLHTDEKHRKASHFWAHQTWPSLATEASTVHENTQRFANEWNSFPGGLTCEFPQATVCPEGWTVSCVDVTPSNGRLLPICRVDMLVFSRRPCRHFAKLNR